MSRVLNGLEGSLTLPTGLAAKLRAFSLSLSQAFYDSTGFSSAGHVEGNGGLRSASGKAMGWLTSAGAGWASVEANGAPNAVNGIATGLVCTCTSGYTYSFSAVITNIQIGTDVSGNQTVEFDFQSTGLITEVAAGS